MKTLFKKISERFNRAVIAVKATIANKRAEGYVDSGVKILIAVVIGALLLSLLYALFKNTIMPSVTSKVTDIFNYAG